jgi:hypothetical protein
MQQAKSALSTFPSAHPGAVCGSHFVAQLDSDDELDADKRSVYRPLTTKTSMTKLTIFLQPSEAIKSSILTSDLPLTFLSTAGTGLVWLEKMSAAAVVSNPKHGETAADPSLICAAPSRERVSKGGVPWQWQWRRGEEASLSLHSDRSLGNNVPWGL